MSATTHAGVLEESRVDKLKHALKGPELGTWIGLIGLGIVLSIVSPNFFTLDNGTNVLRQAVEISLLALGMTFVILTAGIDLSVASVAALAATAFGVFVLLFHWPIALAVVGGIVAGIVCGVLNGILISWLKIPAFIVTLGTMGVFRGAAYQLTAGAPLSGLPKEFTAVGLATLGPIPVSVLIAAVCFILGGLVLKYTKLGAYTYTLGGNPRAARYVGIPVGRYTIAVYAISGLTAAVAGLLLTARVQSVQPTLLTGGELDAVAAVVIGGTSLFGGRGSVVGTVAGALLLSMIRNGLNLLAVSSFIQMMVIGVVVILAVGLDRLRSRGRTD